MAGENWYLKALREGFTPDHEANTSRHVQEVLRDCLGWPFDKILPQKSGRGFIDYLLRFPKPPTEIRIEVKRLHGALRDEDVRKYLVRPGRSPTDFRVGVLTNFKAWSIYVAGQAVTRTAGTAMVRLRDITIESRAHIAELDTLIGYRNNGSMAGIRAALAETDEVIAHLVETDREVLKEIRRQLGELRERHALVTRVPQHDRLADIIARVRAAAEIGDGVEVEAFAQLPFTRAKLTQAICSLDVADVINRRLVEGFDASTRRGRVHETVRRLFRPRGN